MAGRISQWGTDHRPLVNLREKSLFEMTPRLQKMFLRLRPYTFDLVHKPGKSIPAPDCMSRLYMAGPQSDEVTDVFAVTTEEIRTTHSFSSRRLLQVQEETKKDPALQKLISVLRSPTWPDRSELDLEIKPYSLEEMAVVNGIVLKGERVVIPTTMRREILGIIHESHLGMVRCKQLARDIVYWPGLSKQIEDLVSRCEACQTHRSSQQKEPLLPTEVPERPWQILGTDLFEWEKKKFLIVADYYSEWFEIEQLTQDSTAKTVIGSTSKWFATHGIPEKVIGDNGPPFHGYEYAGFARKFGFTHQTISPYHSQANGLIEKCVGIAKAILSKCKQTKQDPYLALLNHRNTPRDGVGSPAQHLLGRRTCTRLPTTASLLKPSAKEPQEVTGRLLADRGKAKSYYDRGAKALPKLQANDTVRVRSQEGTWGPARLLPDKHPYRSHSVMVPSGRVYRRNRRDILKTQEDPGIFERATSLHIPEDDGAEDTQRREATPIAMPQWSTSNNSIPVPGTPKHPIRPPAASAAAPQTQPTPITRPEPPMISPPSRNVSRQGRVRKPSRRYDPKVYQM